MHELLPNVVDLFCGVGGLTKGLADAGLTVVAGIDFDGDCEFAYSHNNRTKFYRHDVATLDSSFVHDLFPERGLKILSGCAPCQPFSRYGRGAVQRRSKWSPPTQRCHFRTELPPNAATLFEKLLRLETMLGRIIPLAGKDELGRKRS